jgi:hypothetical protein
MKITVSNVRVDADMAISINLKEAEWLATLLRQRKEFSATEIATGMPAMSHSLEVSLSFALADVPGLHM